jgi:hypothetical protein
MNIAPSPSPSPLRPADVVGIIHPAIDAHTLGGAYIAQQLRDCGVTVAVGDGPVSEALMDPLAEQNLLLLRRWLARHRVSHLGYSYRLDPENGLRLYSALLATLRRARLLHEHGGPLRGLYFAGLPATCELVVRAHGHRVVAFRGDEAVEDTLELLGVPPDRIPTALADSAGYDRLRRQFGETLVRRREYLAVSAPDRGGADYPEYGSLRDTLEARLASSRARHLPPLTRAHCGPYLEDRREALRLYEDWARALARNGLLDVLSIGSSQLTQSNFGGHWSGKANGGGVPINSVEEFRRIRESAYPMLVRTYAGTRDVPYLSSVYETALNTAWHALSFWWFNQIDGRGPNSVRKNLAQHFETMRLVARYGKPLEANVAHHFSFRGADDVSAVLATVLAARAAKLHGIGVFIYQCMLNTPKFTWGVQDLAKARATLALLRPLEDARFRVVLQPRAGLAYFSSDEERARGQLAAVTALMDDIEPGNEMSPPIIHVVSYTEGTRLADPPAIDESIRITRQALADYRALRRSGEAVGSAIEEDVAHRTAEIVEQVRALVRTAESYLPQPYSAEGFYRLFRAGAFAVPDLWEGREEFAAAASQRTRVIGGRVAVVGDSGAPLPVEERVGRLRRALRETAVL